MKIICISKTVINFLYNFITATTVTITFFHYEVRSAYICINMSIKDESLFATSTCWKHGGKRTYTGSLSSKLLTVSYKIKQITFKRFILLSLHYFSEQSSWDNIAYMVFQKIEHDIERWRNMDEERQDLWIGRSKATGLLLGTIFKNEDRKLADDLYSDKLVQQAAKKKWKK